MPGPMSLAMNDPKTLGLGMQFLQDGTVSPEEVHSVMQGMSTPADALAPPEQSPWAAPTKKSTPISGKKTEKKETFEDKKLQKRDTHMDESTFQGLTDILQNSDAFQQQQKGIDDSEALLKMSMEKDQGDNADAWLRPLSAYVDSTFGSKISQGLPAQQTPGAKQAGYMNALDDLQKRRGDLSKSVLEGVTKLKSGSDTNQQNQLMSNQLISTIGMMNGGGAGGALGEMRRRKQISDAGAAFDKNPILLAVTKTTNSLDRAISMLTGKDPLTNSGFNLAQQDFIDAVASGGAATEGKVNREKAHALALKMEDLKSYFKPGTDIRKNSSAMKLVDQIMKQIAVVKHDYRQAAMQTVGDIESNYKQIDDEDLQKTVGEKVKRWNDRNWEANPLHTPNASDGKVTKYPTGAPSAAWTPEQLKAFIADHQG